MTKPDKPAARLAHVLRTGHGAQRALGKLVWPTGTSPELRQAIATELAPIVKRGLQFERSKGSKNTRSPQLAAYVESLIRARRTATGQELYNLADRSVIDKPGDLMSFDTFKRYVTEARKALGIKSRRGRPRK